MATEVTDLTKLQPGEVYVDVYMSQRLIMPEADVDTFIEGIHVILELDDNVIIDDVKVAKESLDKRTVLC